MAVTSTKGRIRNIYEGLYTWIKEALEDAEYADYFVSMDYKLDIMNTVHNPIVTIRITPTTYSDSFYGRVWQGGVSPDTGMEALFLFSLHVFSKYNTGIEEDHNRDAWIATRIIVDYLNSLNKSTDLSPRGIYAFDNIRMRESDPTIRNMGRIIIDGEIRTIREDSPWE